MQKHLYPEISSQTTAQIVQVGLLRNQKIVDAEAFLSEADCVLSVFKVGHCAGLDCLVACRDEVLALFLIVEEVDDFALIANDLVVL